MFLSIEEVAKLTGYVKPSAQIKWPKSEEYEFAVDGYGKPKVLRQTGGDSAARWSPGEETT